MKKARLKILIPSSVVVLVTIFACSKSFLDKPPLGTLSPAIMASRDGVNGLLIGAYSLVDGEGQPGDGFASGASNWAFNIASDDAYKGSDPSDVGSLIGWEAYTVSPVNDALIQKWSVCYAGAQRCNDVLKTLAITEGLTDEETTQITAQARFLRAYYHMELKKVWNNIIFVDETVVVGNNDVSNADQASVNQKILDDLQYAADNLPETFPEAGRANKWAAKALMAKWYMFQNQMSTAYPILQDIIANGKTTSGAKYALLPNYFSNFNPAQKNSSESVFAAQTSVQDGSSVDWGADPNGNYGDILNFPYNGGPGGCCGFYNPSQDFANAFKTDGSGLPLLDDWFQGNSVSDPSTPYTGNIDPRVDFSMGRPGIPYLDWGPHPGDAWIRNPVSDGHFSPKKNVFAASQKEQYTDFGSAYWAPTELTANNVNIIRFADVLLWAAECAADAGDLTAALGYVNQVRNRVADHPETWTYKNSDFDGPTYTYTTKTTMADKYVIKPYASFPDKDFAIKAIRMERRLELGMEGNRFFDLVRYGIAAETLNAYVGREKALRPYLQGAVFTKGKNEYWPIPQSEIDNMNKDGVERLKQNPGF